MSTTSHVPSSGPRAEASLPRLDAASPNPCWGLACCVDVETTGLNPVSDEVLELALLLFAFDRTTGQITGILDEYVGLREPRKRIPPEATRIHGITHATVRGKALDVARCSAILEKSEFLVAHNARFDRGFLGHLFPECASKRWLCSMDGVDWEAKGFSSKGLQSLLLAHGILVGTAHRGSADATGALLLLSQRSGSGGSYFSELLRSRCLLAVPVASPAAGGKRPPRPRSTAWVYILATVVVLVLAAQAVSVGFAAVVAIAVVCASTALRRKPRSR